MPASREQLRNGVKARQQKAIDTLAGDLLIAAVATEQNATIVTENTDDFEPFDGVSVEGYRGE